MSRKQATSAFLKDYKRDHILNQLLSKGISYTESGQSIFELNYKQLVRELAIARVAK